MPASWHASLTPALPPSSHTQPPLLPPLHSQAHEASLQWRLGLLSSTAFRTGPALVPFQAQILQILAALADAPSQARGPRGLPAALLLSVLAGWSGAPACRCLHERPRPGPRGQHPTPDPLPSPFPLSSRCKRRRRARWGRCCRACCPPTPPTSTRPAWTCTPWVRPLGWLLHACLCSFLCVFIRRLRRGEAGFSLRPNHSQSRLPNSLRYPCPPSSPAPQVRRAWASSAAWTRWGRAAASRWPGTSRPRARCGGGARRRRGGLRRR